MHELPGSLVVWPLRSGSVVQSSAPTVWASTNRKSQCSSVSRVTWNDRLAPPEGTAIVRMRRLYEESAWPEIDELRAGRRRRDGDVQRRVDRVVEVDAVLVVIRDLELADLRRREVGVHRVLLLPHERRVAVLRLLALQRAVRHDLEAGRHGHAERVRRLVERVVVDRVPRRRHIRLADDDHAVVGREDPALAECRIERQRHALVAHDDRELVSLAQARPGRDRQLPGVAAPGRRMTADRDRVDVQSDEVEIEAGEVLRRRRRDRGNPVDVIRRRVIGDVERVVPDVVAAVAREREVRVADPRRARVERVGACPRCTDTECRQHADEHERHEALHYRPPPRELTTAWRCRARNASVAWVVHSPGERHRV